MSHESSYESVSGFSPKARIRVWFGVGFSVGVRMRVRVKEELNAKTNLFLFESIDIVD